MFAHLGKEFGLFHRVNPQIRFKIQFKVEHFDGITGFLAHRLKHISLDLFVAFISYTLSGFWDVHKRQIRNLEWNRHSAFYGARKFRCICFQNNMEVCAAKTKGAHPSKAIFAIFYAPFVRAQCRGKSASGKVDGWIRLAKIGSWRQNLMVEPKNHF